MKKYISIIIPVYNTEKYLEKCLNSVIEQIIFENLEIICINDASLDSSLEILKKYEKKYKNIIIIDSKVNLRQGGARNLGIARATGEYIGFVDSDDFLDKTMYQKLYEKGKKENSDIVCCDYWYSNLCKNKYHISIKKENTGEIDDEKRKMLIINPESICCKIFKREMIQNKLKFPENLFYEDNYFSPMTMMLCNTVSKIDEALYYYRQDNMSTTRQKNNFNFYDRLITAEMLLKDMKKLNEEKYQNKFSQEIEYIFIKLFYINSLFGSISLFDKYPKKYIKKIKNQKFIYNFEKNLYLTHELLTYPFQKKIKYFIVIKFTYFAYILAKIKKLFSKNGMKKYKKEF